MEEDSNCIDDENFEKIPLEEPTLKI